MDYASLKEAILELYLSVKIRSDDEIDAYNKGQFESEKKAMMNVNGYDLIDQIKQSIESLMNMKMDGSSDTQNEFDLDGEIEIDLPAGAKAGLKDASQDIRLGTDLMNEHLKKSLPIAKGALKREKAEAQLNSKKKQIIDDDALDEK